VRSFAGLSLDAAAEVLGISYETAYRRWHLAEAWLYFGLKRSKPPPAP
jgi:hypothetical protein